MAGIDYSKWNNIEVSDDEDDTHPNIDTPSLFKWRHEARVARQEEFEQKKKATLQEKEAKERQAKELREKIAKEKAAGGSNLDSLTKSLGEVEKTMKEVKEKEEEVLKEEKLRPWNVDTLSKEGFSKTIVNTQPPRKDKEMTEEERLKYMKEFTEKYRDELRHFGFLQKYDDSLRYLQDRTYLACEETANFLVIECINHAMEEKFDLMDHVAHQCICIQYLLELSKQLDIDPRACIASFFKKIQIADDEYKKAFEDELKAFKERIRRRAKEKIAEQMEEIRKEQEEERQARLGPGGLDPAEVFETLPKVLQECFESQDIARLQKAIGELDPKEARYHMKRCVDSGMWKPAEDDPSTNPEDGFRVGAGGDDDEEEVYEEIPDKKE